MAEKIFLILITFLLSPYFYLRVLINGMKRKKTPVVLVIQRGKIGDLVCTTQVFRELKKKYPESFVVVMATPYAKDVIKRNPYVDEVIIFDYEDENSIWRIIEIIKKIKRFNFTCSVICQPDIFHSLISFWAGIPRRISMSSCGDKISAKILSVFNSRNIEFQENDLVHLHHLKLLEPIGVKSENIKMDVFSDKEAEAKAEKFFQENGLGKGDFLVGISPTAGNKFKEWEPEKWTQLADKIIEKFGAKIIFVGGESDKNIISGIMKNMKNKAIDASGAFKIYEMAALLKRFNMFISAINGPMHIADACEVPIVAIAGPVNFFNMPPIGKKKFIVWNPYCCQARSSYIKTQRECSAGHRRCVKDISVDDVYNGVLYVKNLI